MVKQLFELKGTITNMDELIHIRREGIPDLYKRVLTIEMDDTQVLFVEVRNKRLKLLEKEMIELYNRVEIKFNFQGSEKNGKRYNNIYVISIKKL